MNFTNFVNRCHLQRFFYLDNNNNNNNNNNFIAYYWLIFGFLIAYSTVLQFVLLQEDYCIFIIL